MRLKTTVGILLVLLSAPAFAVLALNSPKITAAKLAIGEVPLEVVQLPTDKGVIPVEIRGEKISGNPADGTREAVFVVKNNTGKNIDAISVTVTLKLEQSGKASSSTHYLTRNSLIHPDIISMDQTPLPKSVRGRLSIRLGSRPNMQKMAGQLSRCCPCLTGVKLCQRR